ncbi:hypothetical protein [Paenarthrobacter sp. Z7-10]|uniref:hypothetical protein n=1 Tax=Paenarthrobacter sp. Z7-10 TaxID=2787635 RepID=UPI0022A9D21A|nr:hypothetical protein [Paenarthrobacter sp. Z7-10]
MNIKAQRSDTGGQFSESKGLGTGYTYSITNGTPTGVQTRLIVTNNSWTTVDVAITGWYKTN